jgi:hypothetical protein
MVGGDTVDDATARFERDEAKEKGGGSAPPPEPAAKYHGPLCDLIDIYIGIRAGMSRGQHHEPLSHQEIVAFRDAHPELCIDSADVYLLRDMDAYWIRTIPKPAEPPPGGGRGRFGRG